MVHGFINNIVFLECMQGYSPHYMIFVLKQDVHYKTEESLQHDILGIKNKSL